MLNGRCLPYGGVALWPLTQILRRLPVPAQELLAGAPHGELVVERLWTGRIEDRYWAARKLLEALARQRPLLVVLEDLQWAEQTFLGFVEQVAGQSADAPILLLCLATPRLLDLRPDWPGEGRGAITITLPAPPDDQNGTTGTGAERLRRLGTTERTVLECAAVEGPVFHGGAVAALAPPGLRDELQRRLASLVGSGLITPGPAELPGEQQQGYRFPEPRIREAAYNGIPRERRAELHERYAHWLKRTTTGSGDDAHDVHDDGILGYHLEQACRYRREIGPLDRRGVALERRAAKQLGAAGRRAQALVDLIGGAAANLLGRAVGLLGPDDPMYRDLLPDLVAALAEPAHYRRAQTVIDEGLELARAVPDRRLAARLHVERAWLRFHVDPTTDLAEVVREIEPAVPVLEELRDDRALARAWFAHGSCMFALGRAEEAKGILERAVRHAELAGDRRAEVDAVWQLAGPLFWGPTPAGEAIRACRELRERLPRVTQPDAFMIIIEAAFTAMSGRITAARALYQQAQAMYRELGVSMADGGVPQYSSRLDLLIGDVEAAAAQLGELCRVLERRGETGYLSTTAGLLAEALYRLGRHEQAQSAIETCERTMAADDFGAQMLSRGVRAKLLARRGEHERAEQLARAAVAIGEPTDYLFMRGDSLRDLAEVLLLAGRRDAAASPADAALELYERKGDLVSATNVRDLLSGAAAGSARTARSEPAALHPPA